MQLNKSTVFVTAFVLLYSTGAAAQLSFHDPATNQGILDLVVSEFATRAAGWRSIIQAAATRLYWTLVTISMVWTFGMMALRKADIGEFFAEFVRFTIFTGFFWWLLTNGPNFASSIYLSLRQLGETAIGVSGLSPSGIVDVGFMIWKQAVSNLTVWQPIDSFVGIVLSAGILILLAVVAVNMLLLLVSGWILAYAGIFFLGFGGSRWTSDMAINYYKTVLGVAAQLMTMVLLVGIGNDMLSGFYAKMTKGTLNFEELGVMLVFCLALLLLVSKVPTLISGIITGASTGGAGIGQFGAGAIAGAAMTAASVGAAGVKMAAAGAMQAVGAGSALSAAFQKAQASMDGGSAGGGDLMAAAGGGGSSDSGSGSSLASAMGDSGGRGGGGDSGGGSSSSSSGGTQSSGASASSDSKEAGGKGGVLARTVGELGRAAKSMAKESFDKRVGETLGGKLAERIQPSKDKQTADKNDEVAAFVNRTTDTSPDIELIEPKEFQGLS